MKNQTQSNKFVTASSRKADRRKNDKKHRLKTKPHTRTHVFFLWNSTQGMAATYAMHCTRTEEMCSQFWS